MLKQWGLLEVMSQCSGIKLLDLMLLMVAEEVWGGWTGYRCWSG